MGSKAVEKLFTYQNGLYADKYKAQYMVFKTNNNTISSIKN